MLGNHFQLYLCLTYSICTVNCMLFFFLCHSVNPGHGICIWAWTIRNLSHSFPSLPPWRLCLFLLLRYLQGNHVYVKKWSVGKRIRDWKTIGGILAWESQEYPNLSYPSHLSSKWVPQGRHKYRESGRIKQNATWVFVVVVVFFEKWSKLKNSCPYKPGSKYMMSA